MPRWVAQQWHVLRVARSTGNVLGCARRPGVATLRTFAQRTAQDASKTLTLSTRNSAIIIPRCIEGIQPRDLIAAIEPIEPAKYITEERLAVFFLTPAFARWLLDDEKFLRFALQRVFEKVTVGQDGETIHALAAVVDKLPTPRAIEDLSAIEEEVLQAIQTPPVTDTGHEGLSYTTLSYGEFQYAARGSPDEHSVVNFLNAGGSNKESSFCDSLRLPLANTIFQTGSPTTMTLSAWVKQEDSKKLKLKSKTDLSRFDMRLPQDMNVESRSALAVPLIAITVPRMVEAGMGNILRRITGPDGKSVPASEELEKVVPEYFKARNEPARSMSVWALLIPKQIADGLKQDTERIFVRVRGKEDNTDPEDVSTPWTSLWKSDPPIWNDLVTSALSKGARLHRVLSGGGGWGKKAGLLSLDPSAMSEEIEMSSTQELPFPEKEAGDLSAALQEVMKPGDLIQFFASPTLSNPSAISPAETIDSLEILQRSGMRTPWLWEFGMVPSTSDAIQASTWQHHTPMSKSAFVFRNTFGALSEGGLTLKRQYKLQGEDSPAVVSPTKIDVPFSRFSSVDLKDGVGEEEQDSGVEPFRKFREEDFSLRNSRSSAMINDESVHEYRHTLTSISKMANKFEKEAPVVRQLDEELTTILSFIWFRATLIAATNNSAVNTYLLHTFLRWQLASMVSSRQGDSLFKNTLMKRLKHLRSFNKILFVQFKPPISRFITKQLVSLETQRPLVFAETDSDFHTGRSFREMDPLSMWELYRGQLDRSQGPRIRYLKARPRIQYLFTGPPSFASTFESERKAQSVRSDFRKPWKLSKWANPNQDAFENGDGEPKFLRFGRNAPSSPIKLSPNREVAIRDHAVAENERKIPDVNKRNMVRKGLLDNKVEGRKPREVGADRPDITEKESKVVQQLTHRKREAKRDLLEAVGGWLGSS